jgi:DNA-binding LacI/PurR family transcriptional regulator
MLRRDIENGRFPVFAPLPAGVVLCEEYGVSHPTFRKAVASLADENRLVVKHGAGTFVAPPPKPRNGATRTVAVMSIAQDALLRSLQSALLRDGYLMNVYLQAETHWDPAEEGTYLEHLREQPPAALLAFCSPIPPTHETALRGLEQAGVRVIHYGHYRVQPPEQEYLLPDYRRAAHMAAVRLLMAGCREILLLGRWSGAPSGMLMEEGFRQAHEEHVGPYDPGRRRIEMLHASETYEEDMRGLVDSFPNGSGVVCTSATLAERIQRTLDARGGEQRGVRLIGIENGSEPEVEGVDTLRFGRRRIMKRLVAAATGRDEGELRELVPPVWHAGGKHQEEAAR